MNYKEALDWRYAVKRMNGQKVPAAQLDNILHAIHNAPTSMGLQPIEVLVIQDEATRKKIAPIIYNQPQVTEGSALVVFTYWDEVKEQHVDAYMNDIIHTRGVDAESVAPFRNTIMGYVNSRNPEDLRVWASRQAYIALGFGLMAAAMEEVDATPMEGFDAAALDEALGLKERGLRSVALMAVGYRDAEKDMMHGLKKVRRAKERFFTHL